MIDLTGKVALVTGASKGIGAGIARGLASAGAAVAVNYANDRTGAEATVNAIAQKGGRALAVRGDVSNASDVARIFETVQREFGALDVLVNNAAVFSFEPLENVTEEEFHREFNINVLAPILTSREALKYFPASGGSIVNISSIVSENPAPQSVVYSSTKGALDAVTSVLAKELGQRKIRVNTVAPGVTDTEGVRTAGIPASDMGKAMVSMTPLGRIGTPDDIAPVVAFLASDQAAWITGERISASGGLL